MDEPLAEEAVHPLPHRKKPGSGPTAFAWHTIHINVGAELAFDKSIRKRASEQAPIGPVHSAPIMGSSPGGGGWWGPVNSLGRTSLQGAPASVMGTSPASEGMAGSAGALARRSMHAASLRSERVLEWVARRGRGCRTLVMDFSNTSHDFGARAFALLLGLAKSGLQALVLVDSPGLSHQEGYEALSALKHLAHLHVEGIPQDFLHLTTPYLCMLPALKSLRFKPDLAAYPHPAKLGPLPPSLEALTLSNLWVEGLPAPFGPAVPPPRQALPVSTGASGTSGSSSAATRLSAVSFHECHISAQALVTLAAAPSVKSLRLRACTVTPQSVVHTPGGLVAVNSLGSLPLPLPAGGACGLATLSLAACGLRRVEACLVAPLASLRELDLSHNTELGTTADAVPAELSRLTALTSLNMSSCGLTSLPPPVAALPALEALHLEGNSLSALPRDLACTPRLRVANIAQNRLPALPAVLLGATALEELALSSGPVAGTPDFANLTALLPRLARLQVKGATYDCRAVRNLMLLGRRVAQSGATLVIDIVV